MAQDTDVARVAAALRAPGIRYRSFGNEPVRSAATAAGGEFSLLSAGMTAAAEVAAQQSAPAEIWAAPPEPAPAAYARDSYRAEAHQAEAYAPVAPQWAEPLQTNWPAAEPTDATIRARREPTAPSWAEPAQPAWAEAAPPAWAAPSESSGTWAEPAPAAPWSAPELAAPAWPAEPPPAAVTAPASWSPAPGQTPATAPPVAITVAAPEPFPLPVPAQAPAAPRGSSLLQAAEAINSAARRPPLSTLAEIGTAPPPAAPAEPPRPAPTALFPLIAALDLPGGFSARRASAPLAPAQFLPNAALNQPPAAAQPAAAVALPLADLFRLLAAGATPLEPTFALLRSQSARVPAPQT